MFYRDVIIAGRTKLVSLRAVTRTYEKGQKRKPKSNPTPEAVAKLNFRNSVKTLTAKLNHNFQPGDYLLTLTYQDAPTETEARKDLERFLRNLHNHCKKRNVRYKWIAVTEYKHHRIHHHVVMSRLDVELIAEKWKYGYVDVKPLDDTGNYYKLAEYLLKETEKTFREAGSPSKRRYSCSRSIVTPETRREKISSRKVSDEIQVPKGYYLDEDTVRVYDHAILDVECKEYILVSLDGPAKGRRGKRVRPEKIYRTDQQLEFDMEHWREWSE